MFQDSRGFIWVATRNGLSVFDGYHFVVINRDNSSSRGFDSNYINKVEQDHQGNILLGSNKGLLNFDGQQFHAYKIYNDQHKLVKTYVNDIVVRRNGQVLIGTSGYGILQTSGKAEDYVCRPVKGAVSKLKYIRRMAEDRLGRVWINTEDGRLLCLDRQGRLTQRLPMGGKQSVSSVACDAQGNVYAARRATASTFAWRRDAVYAGQRLGQTLCVVCLCRSFWQSLCRQRRLWFVLLSACHRSRGQQSILFQSH